MIRDSYSALKQKIEKEIQKLQKQAQALHAKRRGPIINSILKSMREYEITPEDIAAAYNQKKPARAATAVKKSSPSRAAAKRPVPPKYRHSETGETWTGRGKPPRWITNAEAEGKTRDDFLIAKQADQS